MTKGFFAPTEYVSQPKDTYLSLPKCGACGLKKTCKSPMMPPSGEGKKRILVVAEAPGAVEDEKGIQLVGASGRFLRERLAEFNIDLSQDCWLTNALVCRPEDNEIRNQKWIDYCRPNLLRAIHELEPSTIVLLGGTACKSLLGHLQLEKPGMITRLTGWIIPSRELNIWICPTYHPSYVMREDTNQALHHWFGQHLLNAFKERERPYSEPFNDEDSIERIYTPDLAARRIHDLVERGKPIAWDIETNMLKPDGSNARIIAVSLCSGGDRTISFPWHASLKQPLRSFLRSPIPKIGANIKFEERWAIALLKTKVRNWVFDTVQGAHVLDNRSQITSVKFQSFVRLGISPYDRHVAPFLRADGSVMENRIHEIDLDSLLTYCGMDSLVEYQLAELQAAELGISLK